MLGLGITPQVRSRSAAGPDTLVAQLGHHLGILQRGIELLFSRATRSRGAFAGANTPIQFVITVPFIPGRPSKVGPAGSTSSRQFGRQRCRRRLRRYSAACACGGW